MLEEYRKHVAERAAEGLRPNPGCKPNGRACRAAENPPAGEEEFLLDLLTNRVPLASMKPPMSKQASWLLSPKVKPNPHC